MVFLKDNDPRVWLMQRLTLRDSKGLTGFLSRDNLVKVEGEQLSYDQIAAGRHCHTAGELNNYSFHERMDRCCWNSDSDDEETPEMKKKLYSEMELPKEQKVLENERKKIVLALFSEHCFAQQQVELEFMSGCSCVWVTRPLPINFKPNLPQDAVLSVNGGPAKYEEIKAGVRCYTPAELIKETSKDGSEFEDYDTDDAFMLALGQEQRERKYKRIPHPPEQKAREEARQAVMLGLFE
jgi:hypothetical protein